MARPLSIQRAIERPVASSRRVVSLLLSALTLTLFVLNAHAQYRFDHWTTDNGLPQNSVHAVLQTRDGYLWLTTFDGLVRFDGARFTVFNKSNSPGLASNRFVSIFEDRFGDLWAGLEIGGLVRRHQARFTSYINMEGCRLISLSMCMVTKRRTCSSVLGNSGIAGRMTDSSPPTSHSALKYRKSGALRCSVRWETKRGNGTTGLHLSKRCGPIQGRARGGGL